MERQRSARHAVTSRTIEENAVRLVLEHGLDAVTVDMKCTLDDVTQRSLQGGGQGGGSGTGMGGGYGGM